MPVSHKLRHARDFPKAIVVMGVAASGKSTVGALLAKQIGAEYTDADPFHPPANIAKMASGTPLTDADRWPWLQTCANYLAVNVATGTPVVLGCSALKKVYRDVLRQAGSVVFVHLNGAPDLLAERISQPRIDPITGELGGHYMKPAMLQSQLDTLEPLTRQERGITVNIDQTPEQIVADILASLPDRCLG